MNTNTDYALNLEKSANVDNYNSSHLAYKEDIQLYYFYPS